MQPDDAPVVGRTVHYKSYGTPGGEYPSCCRAAVVTEVNDATLGNVQLCVFNPSGLFFNGSTYGLQGGQWHWYWDCEGEDA